MSSPTTVHFRSGSRIRTVVTVPISLNIPGEPVAARLATFAGLSDDREHIALLFGPNPNGAPWVRVHSECLTGDVFGSHRCDCGPQLHESVSVLTKSGGALLYLRQEGRDIGLYNKIDAYQLQDRGLDTYAANRALGLPDDPRDYRVAGEMLTALGIDRIRLISNNPIKMTKIREAGIAIDEVVPTGVFMTRANEPYLVAKVTHAGHDIDLEGTGL